jgi:hypothetical protein
MQLAPIAPQARARTDLRHRLPTPAAARKIRR